MLLYRPRKQLPFAPFMLERPGTLVPYTFPCWPTDREALLQAMDHPQPPANAAKLTAIRSTVTSHIAQAHGLRGIDELHKVLHQACARIFPAVPVVPPPKPWQTTTVQTGIKAMWAQWRAFKRIRKNGLQGWFAAWKAWKAFNTQDKRHQAACREAPSLSSELLCDQLMQTPRRKAVPCNHPPSAVWRCCADIIAPWVCDTLRVLWATVVCRRRKRTLTDGLDGSDHTRHASVAGSSAQGVGQEV